MLKGKSSEEIAEDLEEDVSIIDQLKKAIITYKKDYADDVFHAEKVLEYYKK